jgi:hypothetical protein
MDLNNMRDRECVWHPTWRTCWHMHGCAGPKAGRMRLCCLLTPTRRGCRHMHVEAQTAAETGPHGTVQLRLPT